MDLLPTDAAGLPRRWLIVFRPDTKSRWVRWLVPGRFKHVRAIGCVPECDAWIFYDVGWGHTSICLARGRSARAALIEWTAGAEVLAMEPRDSAATFRPVLCCTSAIRHLLGLPGSTLRPTALYHDLLANGAVKVDGRQTAAPATDSSDRPDA